MRENTDQKKTPYLDTSRSEEYKKRELTIPRIFFIWILFLMVYY